jgi:hypothetical protein
MVILENLQGVGRRVVRVGDALALEFNASREEEQGNEKEGEAALHEPTLPNRCRMHKPEAPMAEPDGPIGDRSQPLGRYLKPASGFFELALLMAY